MRRRPTSRSKAERVLREFRPKPCSIRREGDEMVCATHAVRWSIDEEHPKQEK